MNLVEFKKEAVKHSVAQPYTGRMVVCQTRFAGSKIYAQFCMKRCRRCELWVKVKKPVAPFVIDGLPQGELELE